MIRELLIAAALGVGLSCAFAFIVVGWKIMIGRWQPPTRRDEIWISEGKWHSRSTP